jgi:hypothetical protein
MSFVLLKNSDDNIRLHQVVELLAEPRQAKGREAAGLIVDHRDDAQNP